jgi:hypothetical protein
VKITRLGPTRPLFGIDSITSGGIDGQVPTATGSNGTLTFGSNIATVTVNGTTQVLGPRINFANGSNTTVTVDMVGSTASNTIRIHATGGGSIDVTDGTTTVSPASTVDFDPTYFDVTAPGGGVAEVTFVGASGSTVDIEDEGAAEGAADTIDFVGAGVSVGFSGGTATVTIPGGGGASYGQVIDYPTSFTGDVINGSSTTPFVDVAAFDTKQVLNSRILHLQSLGASKSHRVRVTLGTTKAGAFDVRACLSCINQWYSTNTGDTYTQFRLSTSGDVQLAAVYFYGLGSAVNNRRMTFRVGGTGPAGVDDNHEPWFAPGTDVTLRITRDGSDVIRFYFGMAQAPMALVPVLRQQTGNYGEAYSTTQSGTLARIEIAHLTPSGPGSTFEANTFVDYVASV